MLGITLIQRLHKIKIGTNKKFIFQLDALIIVALLLKLMFISDAANKQGSPSICIGKCFLVIILTLDD